MCRGGTRVGFVDGTPAPKRWFPRLHPQAADALLAAAVVAVELGLLAVIARQGVAPPFAPPDRLTVLLVGVQGLALTWRRRYPLAVFGLVLLANTAYYVLDYPLTGYDFGLGIAIFSTAGGAGAVFAGMPFLGLTSLLFFASGMWVWGRYMRARRMEFAAHAERAERQRVDQADRAVAAERARIARELHDVVAHHMSVMVIQAGAAGQLLDQQPERARDALAAVQDAGRQGLSAMPGLLRALRANGDGATRVPQPTLRELEALLAQVRTSGLPVDARVEGTPRPLPPGIDLSAYRIVQEALTNTRKHAGPARAEVVVSYGTDELTVTVTDDGHGASTDGGGYGLVGMRERVGLFGGKLRAGTRPDGGYAVSARFPLAAVDASSWSSAS